MNGKRFESALHPSRYQHAAVGATMLTSPMRERTQWSQGLGALNSDQAFSARSTHRCPSNPGECRPAIRRGRPRNLGSGDPGEFRGGGRPPVVPARLRFDPAVKVAALRLAFLALVLGLVGEDVHRMDRPSKDNSLPWA